MEVHEVPLDMGLASNKIANKAVKKELNQE